MNWAFTCVHLFTKAYLAVMDSCCWFWTISMTCFWWAVSSCQSRPKQEGSLKAEEPTTPKERILAFRFFCDAALIAVFLFFTRWLPFPAWWTDGLFPPSGGIEVPESHACAWWVKSKIRYIEVTRTESFLEGKGGEEKRTRRREKSRFSKPLTLLKKQRWTIKQRMDVWIYFPL